MSSVTLTAGIAALPAAPASAATSPVLKVSPTNPVRHDLLTFSGKLTTPLARRVLLQVWSGSSWAAVESGTSNHSGSYWLQEYMPATPTRFRVYAPAAAGRRAQASQVRSLAVTVPTASLTFGTPDGQLRDGATLQRQITARFTPPRADRPVALERLVDGKWVTIRTGKQAGGKVVFSVYSPEGDKQLYRATTAAFRGAAAARTAPTAPSGWRLMFADDFDGTALDTSKWNYRLVGRRFGKRVCSESSPDTVAVSGGRLEMSVQQLAPSDRKATDIECPFGEFKNAMIGTYGNFDFKYGVMAVRMRVPYGKGQHGSLFSQPATSVSAPGDPARSGAEIDVVEYFGDGTNGPSHRVHWTAADGNPANVGAFPNLTQLLRTPRDWSDDYHVYSVEWTPTSYVFKVDGTETWRTDRGVSQISQYLILSLLTSDWELPRMDTTKLNPMSVDWVRVWQR